MSMYPPPPWTLGGWGVAAVGLVDIAAAAAFVPAGASVVPVAPGKTLGGLMFLAYEHGSLTYNELNIVSAIVRVGLRFAFYLPRLYVDSPASLAGGLDIWSVPKELADFAIQRDARTADIAVRQYGRDLCRLRCASLGPRLRLPLPMPSIGARDDAFLFFTGSLLASLGAARIEIEMPANGEFAPLGLQNARFGVRCDDLMLRVPAPVAVARRVGALVPS